jgi:hypothetical protein
MKKILVFAIIYSIILGCSQNSVFNPTLYKNCFHGITFTNENGEINGFIDPDDWQFYRGTSPYFPPIPPGYTGTSSEPGNVIYPIASDIKPAYPNPTNDAVAIEFAFGYAVNWALIIINEQFVIVDSLSGHSDAGVTKIVYSFRPDNANRLRGGFYRVIYRFGHYTGHGDIWIR